MNPDNDAYIMREGRSPNTRVAISMKNKLYAAGARSNTQHRLGVVSTFDPSESRTIDPVRGVGHGDQIAELVPGVTDAMSLSLNRTMLYLANAYQVLGYNAGVDGVVRSLKHHQWPFDIKQELVFSELVQERGADAAVHPSAAQGAGVREATDSPALNAIITVYEACWIENYSTNYSADQAQIVENLSIKASDVIDGASTYYGARGNTDPSFTTGNNPFADTTVGSQRFAGT